MKHEHVHPEISVTSFPLSLLSNNFFFFIYFISFLSVYFIFSSVLSFECQPGYFFLGKPKNEHLKAEHREALGTFFACQGMLLLANKVDVYYRLKMRRQTITCLLYERAKTTCSYTVLYQDSSGQSQFGDICCYVHHQGLYLAIVKQHRTVPGSFITYKGFNLLNHMSQVVYCNHFVAVKLEQLRDICVKVEVAGKNDVFISRFPNLVERN